MATIPPQPLKSPVIDKGGLMTKPWADWFRQIFNTVGGGSAPSSTSLNAQLATLQAEITALQGLGVGRQL